VAGQGQKKGGCGSPTPPLTALPNLAALVSFCKSSEKGTGGGIFANGQNYWHSHKKPMALDSCGGTAFLSETPSFPSA
jgi:hypothetical protein